MIELRTLGSLDLRDHADGRALNSVLAQPKRAAFLVFLALGGPGRFHRRDTLLGVFWPESGERQARHSLSQAVYLLKRSLGPDTIVLRGEEEVALSFDHVRCDAVEFERLLVAGEHEAALDLYHGELLQGFYLDSVDFERWLSAERLRLQAAAVKATRHLAALADAAHDEPAAIRHLRRGVEWAPFDEALRRELMSRLAHGGDRSGALLEYDALARRLKRDLDIDPSAETSRLAASLRRDGAVPAGERSVASTPAGVATASPVGAAAGRRSTLLRRAALIAPLVLLAAASPLLLKRDAASVSASVDERVAVLPFDVRGSEQLAYLGEGLALLLSAKLDGAGALRGVDPQAVLNFVDANPDEANGERARSVARRFGAGQYVHGSLVEAGGRLSLQVGLYDADGELRTQASADAADEAGIFAAIDDVARTLIASRYGSDADRMARLGTETTTSLAALKAYLEGEHDYRHGRFAEAAAAFTRAAIEDSTFALAHYRLSLSSLWADVPDTLPFDAEARALRHASRLSEHDHELLVAYQAWRRGDAYEAERRYRNVLALYPHDVEAAFQLGETLFHYNWVRARPISEAREPLERVVQLDGEHWGALWHLFLIAGSEGRSEEMARLGARLHELQSSAPQELELRALEAFAAHDEAAIARVLTELRGSHPLQIQDVAWRVAVHARDPAGARRVALLSATADRHPSWRQTAVFQVVWLELALGRDSAAHAQLDALGSVGTAASTESLRSMLLQFPLREMDDDERSRLVAGSERLRPDPSHAPDQLTRDHTRALLAFLSGDTAAALRLAAAFESRDTASRPFGAYIRAAVALRGGSPDVALRQLDAAPLQRWFGWASSTPMQSGTDRRWLRAEALRLLGRDDEALRWYGSFADGSLHDLAWLAPAELRSAEINDRLGRREQAARHYARFVELWAGADAVHQPLVRRARDRLALLSQDS